LKTLVPPAFDGGISGPVGTNDDVLGHLDAYITTRCDTLATQNMADPNESKPAQSTTPPDAAWYLKPLRIAGVAIFGAASVIGLVLLATQSATLQQKFWMIVGWLVAAGAVVLSYLSARRAAGDPDQTIPKVVIFDAVCFLTAGLLVVSFWTGPNGRVWAATVIWSLAFVALGGLTGFLFGVPRSRREKGATAAASDASPIEQISDWLTKIIVGLGLVNLKELPPKLDVLAHYVGSSVSAAPSDGAPSFALGLIIYFSIFGFMSCYILTQMFLLKFINRFQQS
jgi:hypothetical protein